MCGARRCWVALCGLTKSSAVANTATLAFECTFCWVLCSHVQSLPATALLFLVLSPNFAIIIMQVSPAGFVTRITQALSLVRPSAKLPLGHMQRPMYNHRHMPLGYACGCHANKELVGIRRLNSSCCEGLSEQYYDTCATCADHEGAKPLVQSLAAGSNSYA